MLKWTKKLSPRHLISKILIDPISVCYLLEGEIRSVNRKPMKKLDSKRRSARLKGRWANFPTSMPSRLKRSRNSIMRSNNHIPINPRDAKKREKRGITKRIFFLFW